MIQVTKRLVNLSAALMVLSAGATAGIAQSNESPGEPRSECLFNGHDLSGWQEADNWTVRDGAVANWTVRDGEIVCTAPGRSLVYRKTALPQSFELEFEWAAPSKEKTQSDGHDKPKIPVGLFSLSFRAIPVTNISAGQTTVTHDGQIAFRFGLGTGWLTMGTDRIPLSSAPNRDSQSFSTSAREAVVKPAGEWNSGRIVFKGNAVQHWVNDKRLADVNLHNELESKENQELGEMVNLLRPHGLYLQLQDESGGARFRNLRIKTLGK